MHKAYNQYPTHKGVYLLSSPSESEPWHLTGLPAPTIAPDRWTAWVERGTLRALHLYSEDPRAFQLRGRTHMIFTRKNLNHYRKVWLAQLEPTGA